MTAMSVRTSGHCFVHGLSHDAPTWVPSGKEHLHCISPSCIRGIDFFSWDDYLLERNNEGMRMGRTHCRVLLRPNARGPYPWKSDQYPLLSPHWWSGIEWLAGLARRAYDRGRMSSPGFCQLLLVITEEVCEVAVYMFRTCPPAWIQQRQWAPQVTLRRVFWVETTPDRALRRHVCVQTLLRDFALRHWEN